MKISDRKRIINPLYCGKEEKVNGSTEEFEEGAGTQAPEGKESRTEPQIGSGWKGVDRRPRQPLQGEEMQQKLNHRARRSLEKLAQPCNPSPSTS